MAANDTDSIAALIKTFFTPERVQKLYQRDYPLLAMLRKTQYEGSPIQVPVITGRGAGIASTLSGAAASAKGVTSDAFLIKPAKYVGVIPLDDEVMETMRTNKGGFVDYASTEFEAKILGMGLVHSGDIFGNGGGSRGVVESLDAANNRFKLVDLADALNIWEGDIIRFSTEDGSDGAHVLKVGQCLVESVDRDTGYVTVDNEANITGDIDPGDNVFLLDMFSAGNTRIIAKGLRAWITPAAATGDFWSVTRTNRTQLSGIRLPASLQVGGPVDRITALHTHMFQTQRVRAGTAWMNPVNWARAAASMGNQGIRPIQVGDTEAIKGYEKLRIYTQGGMCELMSDPSCRLTDAFVLDLKHWWIHHLSKDMVRIVSSPTGEEYVPSTSILGFDVRMASYWNMCSNAPWTGGYTTMPGLQED